MSTLPVVASIIVQEIFVTLIIRYRSRWLGRGRRRAIAITFIYLTNYAADRITPFLRHRKYTQLWEPKQKIAVRENGVGLAQILTNQAHHSIELRFILVVDETDSGYGLGICTSRSIIASFA